MFLITNGCENEEKPNPIDDLVGFIASIESIHMETNNDKNILNLCNPFEAFFEDYEGTIMKIISKKKKSHGFDSRELFNSSSLINMPELDASYLDNKSIKIITSISELMYSNSHNQFVLKCIELENYISAQNDLEDGYKDLLLVYCATLRHISNVAESIYSGKELADETWEEYFIRKQEEMMECEDCIVEQIYCVLTWPTCLGTMAADCLLAVIFD